MFLNNTKQLNEKKSKEQKKNNKITVLKLLKIVQVTCAYNFVLCRRLFLFSFCNNSINVCIVFKIKVQECCF